MGSKGSKGQVRLNEIFAMLEKCAPEHTIKQRPHNYAVMYKGNTYHRLPLGKHGRRDNPEIQVGHVRSMVKYLEIDSDCAASVIPLLAGK